MAMFCPGTLSTGGLIRMPLGNRTGCKRTSFLQSFLHSGLFKLHCKFLANGSMRAIFATTTKPDRATSHAWSTQSQDAQATIRTSFKIFYNTELSTIKKRKGIFKKYLARRTTSSQTRICIYQRKSGQTSSETIPQCANHCQQSIPPSYTTWLSTMSTEWGILRLATAIL